VAYLKLLFKRGSSLATCSTAGCPGSQLKDSRDRISSSAHTDTYSLNSRLSLQSISTNISSTMSKTVANINSVACDRMLEGILLYAAQGSHEETGVVGSFLRMIELASVCRQWRFRLIAHICRTAIAECKRVPHQNAGNNSPSSYKWISNIKLITAMGLSSKTRELYIYDIDGKGTSSFSAAMEATRFGSYSWDRVSLLKFGRGAFKDTEAGNPGVIGSVFSILTSNFPSISNVNYLLDSLPRTSGTTLRAMLINHYTSQSMTVCIREWNLTASLGLLRQDITKLDISTSVMAGALQDLRFPNSSLQYLRVTDVERCFRWDWFRSDANEWYVVFPELKELVLEFVCMGDDMGTMSIARFGLRFPKLLMLRALNGLLYYSDFYTAFVDSPLESLYIAEMGTHLEYVDSRVIRNVHALEIRPMESTSYLLHMVSPYSHLLSVDSMAQAAILVSIPPYMLPAINWTNLREVELDLDRLEFEPIDALLLRLPFIKSLSINYFVYSWQTTDDYHPHCTSSDSPVELLSMSLQYVSLAIKDKNLGPVCVKWLCTLIPHIPSLLTARVPHTCVDEIKQFVQLSGKDIGIREAACY
ncbi:hypothetical protein DL89DRAFT_311102, partial [Linderina pennispora]